MKLCYPIIRYREHGEIGKHSGLKIRRREASRFKSGCSHQPFSNLSELAGISAAEGIAVTVFTIVLLHRCGPVQFTSNCRSPIISKAKYILIMQGFDHGATDNEKGQKHPVQR